MDFVRSALLIELSAIIGFCSDPIMLSANIMCDNIKCMCTVLKIVLGCLN